MSGDKNRFRFIHLVASSLRNRPSRNIATVFAFAMIAATLFCAQYLMTGAQTSLDAGLSRMGADLMVVPEEYSGAAQTVLLRGEPTTFFFHDSGFEKIAGMQGVAKASPGIYIGTLYGHSCCSGPVQIMAIDPERDFTVATWLKENPGVRMGKDDVIVGSAIIGDIGSDLLFYGHTFHIVGRLDQTGMGIDMAVFTRIEDAYVMAEESVTRAARPVTIPRGMVSSVLVKAEPGTSPADLARRIPLEVPGTKTITPSGLLAAVSGQMTSVTRLLYGSALGITAISIPLLGFISAMVANERKREISLLRAMGATKGFIIRLLLAESFSLSIIGGLVGTGLAMTLMFAFQDLIAAKLQVPLTVPPVQSILGIVAITLLLSAGIGGISSLYPAIRISGTDPYESIRKEES